MIDYKTIKVGDEVKVVGLGAPGFAEIGDVLTIESIGIDMVRAVKDSGEGANFFDECGAKRLENLDITPEKG